MSSHKFYGPKGVGALYIREGVKCNKLQDGGHQERELRAGTENVAGIVGMGKAIEIAYRDFEEYNKKLTSLRNYYIAEIQSKIPNVKINGGMEHRLPGNANISFKEVDGEELLLGLDNEGTKKTIEENLEQIVKTINHTYRINKLNLVWKQREASNKKTLANQLGGVSKVISSLADDIEDKEEKEEEKIQFNLKIASAKVTKSKSEVSGDTSIQTKLHDGKFMMAISDGMGSRTKS